MATFTQYVEAKNKNLKDLSNEEIYYLLLEFVKEAAAPKPKNDSKRKVYYISAEFLKNEYGTGGSSPGIPGADASDASHDAKGLKLGKGKIGNPVVKEM